MTLKDSPFDLDFNLIRRYGDLAIDNDYEIELKAFTERMRKEDWVLSFFWGRYPEPVILAELITRIINHDMECLDERWRCISFTADKKSIKWLRDSLVEILLFPSTRAELCAKYGDECHYKHWGIWKTKREFMEWQNYMIQLCDFYDKLLLIPGDEIMLHALQGAAVKLIKRGEVSSVDNYIYAPYIYSKPHIRYGIKKVLIRINALFGVEEIKELKDILEKCYIDLGRAESWPLDSDDVIHPSDYIFGVECEMRKALSLMCEMPDSDEMKDLIWALEESIVYMSCLKRWFDIDKKEECHSTN